RARRVRLAGRLGAARGRRRTTGRLMRIHQLIAAAAPGDAVTDQALAWQGILRAWGAEGLVIAEHVHPALEGAARRANRSAAELRQSDGLVLHYSVWSRVVDD